MNFLVSFFLLFLSLTTNPPTADLTVVIKNIDKIEGQIHMGLYDNAESFLETDKEYRGAIFKVTGSEVSYTFEDIPLGVYAISIYHDANKDNECNRNWIGLPSEGYGFSNDFRPSFSAPKFEGAKFTITENMSISITMVY